MLTTHRWKNAMNLQDFDTSNRLQATVKDSQRITPAGADAEVRHIVLSIPGGSLNYDIGESVGVLTPGPHPFGNKEHLRLYSVASARYADTGGAVELALCVRRCFYIDEVSGERYPGIASNHLCDARPGDTIVLTGPYGTAFSIPEENTANLLMIGSGTGIAPFRAFVRHIYEERGGWQGKVMLFYGADTGMEKLYMNDVNNDIGNYYQKETFKAFESLSPSPYTGAPISLERTLEENGAEVWAMLQDPKTYVYLAGLRKSFENLDKAMARIADSEKAWQRKKKELVFYEQWAELVYD